MFLPFFFLPWAMCSMQDLSSSTREHLYLQGRGHWEQSKWTGLLFSQFTTHCAHTPFLSYHIFHNFFPFLIKPNVKILRFFGFSFSYDVSGVRLILNKVCMLSLLIDLCHRSPSWEYRRVEDRGIFTLLKKDFISKAQLTDIQIMLWTECLCPPSKFMYWNSNL